MIVLLTDYGYQGPYVGQLKAKIFQDSPKAKVIDLIHDLPVFNITAAASLIPAITKPFPDNTIFICIVDPGVGSNRKAVLIKFNSNYYIGPDNGLFDKLLIGIDNIKRWKIKWRPSVLSDSFHGRDLFVPVASKLFNKSLNFDTDLELYPVESEISYADNEPRVIYFDGFGNAISSIKQEELTKNTKLKISNAIVYYSKIFSEVIEGQCFWYYNSMGLVEIACNQLSVKLKLKLSIGQSIEIIK